jgi:ligand-binding sensor domain-containing protein/signal transduction histidine kinase
MAVWSNSISSMKRTANLVVGWLIQGGLVSTGAYASGLRSLWRVCEDLEVTKSQSNSPAGGPKKREASDSASPEAHQPRTPLCRGLVAAWLPLFIPFLCAAAEVSPYHARNWQTDAGLPNNVVQAIVQTTDGYLWVGTQYGLARFDGVRFTIFNRNNVPEMRNANILGLHEARDGSLWIATGSGGILKLHNGEFVPYGKAEGLAHDYTLGAVLESKDGAMWFGTLAGVSRIKDGKITNFDQKSGLRNNAVRDICEDQQGTLWLATGGGLDCRTSDGQIHPAPVANGFKGADIRAICCDRQGTIWFGAGNELHRVHNGQHTVFAQGTKLPYNIIRRLYLDRQDNLWVGTYGSLSRFVDGKFVVQSGSDGLPFDLVSALFEDREDNVWVGSRDGLTQFRPKRLMTYTAEQGLPNNNVMSVLEDRNGAIWTGTWGGGLSTLKDGVFKSYTNRGELPVLTLALYEDHSGKLWAGTDYAGTLFRLGNKSLKRFTPAQGLPGRAIRVIYEDSQTNLWVGTSQGLYAGRDDFPCASPPQPATQPSAAPDSTDESAIEFASVTAAKQRLDVSAEAQERQTASRGPGEMRFRPFGAEQGLAKVIVRDVLESRAGQLWVATEKGLWRFDRERGKTNRPGSEADASVPGWETKGTKFTWHNGLSVDATITLYEDQSGDVWIGTAGGGLDRFHEGTFTAFTKANGLFSDTICDILEDERGWLWMSCPRGIFRVSRQELESCGKGVNRNIVSIAYGKGDGMVSELCNGVAKPGAWKSRDGRLWFATSKGACVVDPNAQTQEDRKPPRVVVERVWADKQQFPAKEVLPVRAPIRLPAGHGELEFHYTALSFRAPERNRFKYKLEGVNADWVEAGSRRVAYYDNLAPGKYVFRVLACNNNGIWNEEGAVAEIVLLPHAWQTWWFKLGMSAIAGLVFVGAHRMRLSRLRAIDRLRLRLAADLHDDVGSNLSTISLLTRRLQKQQGLGESTAEDLDAIHRISRQSGSAIREIIWLINPEYDTMKDLVTRMRELADSILTGFEYNFQGPPVDWSHKLNLQFRQNIFLLYKETLTNVARHSQATRVEIKIEQDADSLRMSIQDNGIGFDSAVQSSGNGLKNLKLRAARVKGVLTIESKPGQGTCVAFSAKHS